MKTKHQTKLRKYGRLFVGASGFSLTALAASAANSFLGVAAGDASSTDAILWTRCVDTNTPAVVSLTAQISINPAFGTHTDFSVSTDATKDYTAKILATGLSAGTKYYYRFTDGSVTSGVGTFKTAPALNTAVPISFAFSGDCDGLIRPYALASQLPNKNLDFFMFDGDTEYETSASIGSPAVTSTGTIPAPTSTGATSNQLFADFSRKYREQFLPVNVGGQNCLQTFFAGQGNYTTYDNHELGNKQYINGGAPAGTAVGDFPTGAGVDARVSTYDVNATGSFINKSGGFQTLQQVFLNYQPIKDRGIIVAPSDPNVNGTKQLYFAQQWGKNVIFVNTDCRSYRDIRMKTSSNADDTGSRADAAGRTYLGVTQLTWLEQTLLNAQLAGTTWKFINISDPIDQIGPINSALTLLNAPTTAEYGFLGTVSNLTTTAAATASKTITVASTIGLEPGQLLTGAGVPASTTISAINTDGTTFTVNNNCTLTNGTPLALTSAPSTYAPVNADGGKAWFGGYRAERNALLKFIADNQIRNVVFLATDDHQNRLNEITYSTNSMTGIQSTYAKVPYCFEVVCGPLGATGPDFIQNHTYALAKKMADSIYNAEVAAGIEPIGLQGYPGLTNVMRDTNGTLVAVSSPEAVDFYSPDTFNYNKFDVSADGKTLTVKSYGINSTVQNSFTEYDATNNPERILFSFQIPAADPINNIDHFIVVYQENWSFDALYGSFPGANGLANSSVYATNQLDRLTGNPISLLANYDPAANTVPTQNPPVPLNGTQDLRFLTNTNNVNSPCVVNTLLPYDISSYLQPGDLTGDIVHKYWQEQFQANRGSNNMFLTWSDNPGLVMSHFDATLLPEGKLAQQYTMCDNFFHSAFGGSFLNHQFLIAATPPVYNSMPIANNSAIALLDGNGVFALNTSGSANGRFIRDGSITPLVGDVLTGLTTNGVSGVTLTVGSSGFGSDVVYKDGSHFTKHYVVNTTFTANMCPTFSTFGSVGLIPSLNNTNSGSSDYVQNIGDRLDAASISWKWYSGGWSNALESSKSNPLHPGGVGANSASTLFQWHHQPFAYFAKTAPFADTNTYADGRNPYATAHLQDEVQLYADVASNTLPAVSFVKFLGPDNEHPGYASLLQGQLHVSNLVAQVQANPALWAHTAIIITYDEHGGRWDHVAPPVRDLWGPGVRVPTIIISPYAKTGNVDHTAYDTTAILTTIEKRFGVTPLNSLDANSPTLLNALNTTVSDPATPPTLSVKRNGGALTLSWPGVYLTYVLQSNSTSLLNAAGWASVAGVTNNSVTFPVDTSKTNVFYRLLKQ